MRSSGRVRLLPGHSTKGNREALAVAFRRTFVART